MKWFGYIVRPVSAALRMQEIALVSYRYGIGGALAAWGIEVGKRGIRAVANPPGNSAAKSVPLDTVFGKNLAHTFVKLGPTFIKLGQGLALRPEWVGEKVATELRVLFDRVPPIAFHRIEKILKKELGAKKYREGFRDIEKKALASASLSQTHVARLKDGTEVILKVQKPGAGRLVRLDLSLLEVFVYGADKLYPKYHLKQGFEDFKQATLREINYLEEAKNIDRFLRNYHKIFSTSNVVFPRYYPEFTTERVIALEPLRGKKVTEIKTSSNLAKRTALLSLTAILEQIFDHGFFHADPHAGNLFFLEDSGKVGFIDLGLVGQLDPEDKRKFLKVMLAIIKRDRKELAKSLYDLGTPSPNTSYDTFEMGIGRILDGVKEAGVSNVRIEKVVDELFQVAQKNQILIPNRYVLMIRSCLMIEGVARKLDPTLSLFNVAAPILTKSLLKSYNPFRRFKS